MNVTRRALFGRLSTDAELKTLLDGGAIHYGIAPEKALMPFVVFQEMSSVPNYRFGSLKNEREIWMVKSVAANGNRSGQETGELIANRVDAILHDAELNLINTETWYCRREYAISPFIEFREDSPIYHVGAMYRLEFERE